MTSPPVAIIILNWNNPTDTLECLASVFQLDYDNYHVIVVDNGSTDDSVAQLRARYPDLEIIETGENLGYAEGNNVGIRRALLSDTEHICVLNNDTEVAPDFLFHLVSAITTDTAIGMVGPKVLFHEPRDLIFSAGCSIDWSRGEVIHRGFRQPDSNSGTDAIHEAQDFDALAGCGVLVPREVVESVGYLDLSYFLNFEDIDWCVRISSHGYRIRYISKAILYHKVSASIGQDSPANTYYMTRNALKFFSRYGSHKHRAMFSILIRTLRTVGAWTIKPAYKSSLYQARRRANIQALIDFVVGKDGPLEINPSPDFS